MKFRHHICDSSAVFRPRFEDTVDFIPFDGEYQGVTAVTPSAASVELETKNKYMTQNIEIAAIPEQYMYTECSNGVLVLSGREVQGVEQVQLPDGQCYYDISEDTVEASKMLAGVTAHGSDGSALTGTIPTYAGDSLITDSVILNTKGKYMPFDLFISCDVGRSRTGTFQPEEDIQTFTVSGLGTFTPKGGAVCAAGWAKESALMCGCYISGLPLWVSGVSQSISGSFSFVQGGAVFTLPDGMVFAAGNTYRWYLF